MSPTYCLSISRSQSDNHEAHEEISDDVDLPDVAKIAEDQPTGENKFDSHGTTGENKSKHGTFRANQVVRTSLDAVFSLTSTGEKQVELAFGDLLTSI